MTINLLYLLFWIDSALGVILYAVIVSLATEEILIIEHFACIIYCFLISTFMMAYVGQLLQAFKRWWKE